MAAPARADPWLCPWPHCSPAPAPLARWRSGEMPAWAGHRQRTHTPVCGRLMAACILAWLEHTQELSGRRQVDHTSNDVIRRTACGCALLHRRVAKHAIRQPICRLCTGLGSPGRNGATPPKQYVARNWAGTSVRLRT